MKIHLKCPQLWLVMLVALGGCEHEVARSTEITRAIESLGGSVELYGDAHVKTLDAPKKLKGTVFAIHLDRIDLQKVDLKPLLSVRTLQSGSFHGSNITDEQIALLRNCERLELLDLDSTPITDEALMTIASIKSLKLLYLNRCKITDRGLAMLRDHPNLETINLLDTLVSQEGVADLKERLPQVESISYSTAPSEDVRQALARLDSQGVRVLAGSAARLAKYPEAKNFSRYFLLFPKAWKGSLDKATFDSLSKITESNRTTIDIDGPIQDLLSELGKLSRIHKLRLGSEVVCDDDDFKALASGVEISELHIHNALAAEAAIAHLPGMKKLKHLTLWGSTLTAADALDLSKCTALESLELKDFQFTGNVKSLRHLPSLERIHFKNCRNVFASDIKALRQHGIEVTTD